MGIIIKKNIKGLFSGRWRITTASHQIKLIQVIYKENHYE